MGRLHGMFHVIYVLQVDERLESEAPDLWWCAVRLDLDEEARVVTRCQV